MHVSKSDINVYLHCCINNLGNCMVYICNRVSQFDKYIPPEMCTHVGLNNIVNCDKIRLLYLNVALI